MLLPVLPHDVFTVADALRRGATQRQLAWAVERGRLHRLRRGVLCAAGDVERRRPSSAHRRRLTVEPSPAGRTVTDCLRHLPPEQAVVIGDAALRAELVTQEDLAAAIEQHRWPRSSAASALLPLLDGRRESPLEPGSAVVMHRHDIPAPRVQVRVLDERGRFVARVDTLWEEQGVVGEADGLVKYAGAAPARAVAEEKQREARSQALGLVVVRWTVHNWTVIRPCSSSNSEPLSRRGDRTPVPGPLRLPEPLPLPPPTLFARTGPGRVRRTHEVAPCS